MSSWKQGARVFALTRTGTVHASTTDIENASASALAGAPDGTTLVTLHADHGLQHFVVTPDEQGMENIGFSIARTMEARSTEVDDVPDLMQARGFAHLSIVPRSRPMQDTQQGAEFTALSRVIGGILMPGEWVAVSVRRSHLRSEVKRQIRWLDHHTIRTHNSRGSGAPVMSMWAGGHDASRAQGIVHRVASAIPGFGLSTRGQVVSAARSAAPLFGAFGIAGLLTLFAAWLGFTGAAIALGIVAAATLAGGVLAARGALFLRTPFTNLMRAIAWGRVPAAPVRTKPPRKPHAERITKDKEGRERTRPEFGGDYPLAPSAFLVGPHIPLAIVAPYAQESEGATTAARPAPPSMREHIGPRIGVNMDDAVRLSVADMWAGFAAIGAAGSGKTALLEHLWGTALSERMHPSGVPDAPERHALIAFDTKGDGLATVQYEAWGRHAGDQKVIAIHALDAQEAARTRTVITPDGHEAQAPATIAIDLFPWNPETDSAREWAEGVVTAMVYVWGETSIGPRSQDTLKRVLAAARLVTPRIASRVTQRELRPNASPFYYANLLLTNEGDALAVELAAAIAEAASAPGTTTPDLVDVVSNLSPLFGEGRTPAQRRDLVDAPRTKVSALMSAESWWSHPVKYPWSTILENDIAVIVNMGVGPSGVLPDDKLREEMSALMLHTLVHAIRQTCIGWFEQKRAVSVFADEVKHLANTSADLVTWMRQDGRANGVRAVFATQTPETLIPEVRGTVLGFANLFLYKQDDEDTARILARNLSMSGGSWEPADLANLAKFHAIVRATVDGKRQEPFTVQVPNFRAERDNGAWVA